MFRAFDPDRDRLVAIKLFRLDLPPERVHQLVAQLERLVGAGLTHPAISAPLATGLDRGVSGYLAQEYAAADSLDILLRDHKPAPPADAVRVATQLAGALDFAAAVDITHGALHPRDVLMSPDDTRLTGLGIVRALEQVGLTGPVRRPYTAPERIAGEPWDRRADIFSLAALMHEMLWARRVTATGAQAADALTELPGGDLTAMRRVFARALADDPADRFDTASAFADALRDACAGVATAAPVPAARRQRSSLRLRKVAEMLPLDGMETPRTGEETPRTTADAAQRPTADEPPATTDLPFTSIVSSVVTGLSTDAHVVPSVPTDAQAGTDPLDVDIRAAEMARHEDAASTRILVPPVSEPPFDPVIQPSIEHELAIGREPLVERERAGTRLPAGLGLTVPYPAEPVSALERSRSAMWPLALALVVGLALGVPVGFGAGYGIGTRDSATSAPGREWTEGAVQEVRLKPAPTGNTDVRLKPDATGITKQDTTAITKSDATGTTTAVASGFSRTSAPSGTTTGRLLVRSTPAGARVFVDGTEYGRTPAVVRDLAPGAHRVRVVREGFTTADRRVVITASRPALNISVPLARADAAASTAPVRTARSGGAPARPATTARSVGALSVESRPAGAQVFIDGKLAGTTPLTLDSVAAGAHAVRLERDGYRRWSSSVRIAAGERNRVTASLER